MLFQSRLLATAVSLPPQFLLGANTSQYPMVGIRFFGHIMMLYQALIFISRHCRCLRQNSIEWYDDQ
jgi:hypothetical protein